MARYILCNDRTAHVPHEWTERNLIHDCPGRLFPVSETVRPAEVRLARRWRWPLFIAAMVAVAAIGVTTVVQFTPGHDVQLTGVPGVTQPTATPGTPVAAPDRKPVEYAPGSLPHDGRMVVGWSMKPGRYVATVPLYSAGCTWMRIPEKGAAPVAGGTAEPGARVVLVVAASDYAVDIAGCGSWKRVP